jgi:thiol-disulfide isomerase/thioredoxin
MPDKSAARSPRNLVLTWGLVIAVAAGAGFLLQRRADRTAAPQISVAAPAVPTSAGPVAAATPKPQATPLPQVLPDFELKDRDGKGRRLAEWRGRPLVVNYWATWCPPCRHEIPLLKKLRADRRKQHLEVVGIAVDFREDVLAFAAKEKLDYPLLIGEEDGLEAVKAVGMTPAFPFTLFADSQQRIVALKVGELHQDELDLILDRVAAVDSGQQTLPAAREQISEGLKDLATKKALAAAAAPAKSAG